MILDLAEFERVIQDATWTDSVEGETVSAAWARQARFAAARGMLPELAKELLAELRRLQGVSHE